MSRFKHAVLAALLFSLILFTGCQHLAVDTDKILKSDINLPEVVGFSPASERPSPPFPTFWQ
jgi:hypothetical protein